MLTGVASNRQSRAYRLWWPVVTAAVVLACLGVLAIAGVTAWRALDIVHPPRQPVDDAAVEQALSGSEAVSFVADDGALLSGTYLAPRNGAAVVLVHGLFANREQLLPEAQLLASQGYGVLLYDNRAHGNSGGTAATWGQLEALDAARAVDYLENRTQLPPGKIGLLGLSIGGTAVLREAIDDPRVGPVVVEATYSSMSAEIAYMYGRWGPLSQLPALWVGQVVGGMDYSKLVAENLACSLRGRPLLLVYGSGDTDVPLSEGKRVANAACAPDALLIVNTHLHGRFMQADNAPEYAQRLLTFFGAAFS
jgi:dipeptidyl aminopeptidase/acylaminoacyl peptidase